MTPFSEETGTGSGEPEETGTGSVGQVETGFLGSTCLEKKEPARQGAIVRAGGTSRDVPHGCRWTRPALGP